MNVDEGVTSHPLRAGTPGRGRPPRTTTSDDSVGGRDFRPLPQFGPSGPGRHPTSSAPNPKAPSVTTNPGQTLPTVSVIMASWNTGRFLRPAIRSILAQDLKDLELIIVDDGSTDGSIDAVLRTESDSRLRVIRRPHEGRLAARQCGVDAARADVLAFMDADDVCARDRLSVQLHALQRTGAVACVGPYAHLYTRRTVLLRASTDPEHIVRSIDAWPKGACEASLMVLRDAYPDLRWMAAAFGNPSDKPVMYELITKHGLLFLPEVTYLYRLRIGSLSQGGRRDPLEQIARVRRYYFRAPIEPQSEPNLGPLNQARVKACRASALAGCPAQCARFTVESVLHARNISERARLTVRLTSWVGQATLRRLGIKAPQGDWRRARRSHDVDLDWQAIEDAFPRRWRRTAPEASGPAGDVDHPRAELSDDQAAKAG